MNFNMSVTRLLSPLCLVLVTASSVLCNVPYTYSTEPLQAPLPLAPQLIYGSGIHGSPGLTGFPYFPKGFAPGESQVLLFTEPSSDEKLKNEFAATIKGQLRFWPSIVAAETKSKCQDSSEDVKPSSAEPENAEASTTASPLVQDESNDKENKETPSTPATKVNATTTTTETKEKDAKEQGAMMTLISGQFLGENGAAGYAAPYPILRLGGSAPYYHPELISTQFSGFPGFSGYEPSVSDYFGSQPQQYQPSYSQYDSYQNLYNPFFPSLDGNYYNPGLPLVYQSQMFTPQVSNSISTEKTDSTTTTEDSPNIDRRLGEREKTNGDVDKVEKSEKEAQASAPIPEQTESEKLTELPTSTDQQKATETEVTTAAEAAPTTADSNETTASSTAANDAVAVP